MRPGGGSIKGAQFERLTGIQLSLWLTQGKRSDLFARNVLSGGKFTLATQKGKELGMPGDLMAAHPLAFEFLSTFLVECKHHADLKLEQYFFDIHKKGSLAKIIEKASEEADSVNLYHMVVAMQNRCPAMVFLPAIAGLSVLNVARPKQAMRYHKLHNDSVFICKLEDLVCLVRPDLFLASIPPKGVPK
jgi:hypothetical protein